MFEKKRYTFGELNELLRESSEFKPKKGKNVDSEDKKNNEKAVDDIMKQAKEFDGGLTDEAVNKNAEDTKDYNKTMLDLRPVTKPSDSYTERVKAQVHGFTSAQNEKDSDAKDNESLDYEGNKKFYDAQQKKHKEVSKAEVDLRHAGLKSRELDRKDFENETLFKNENRKMKRLHFKNTVFLSEAQMLKKVPEDFKKADGRFIMKDADNTEYLVECKYDERFNFAKLTVVNKTNKKQLAEQLSRMNALSGYDSSDYFVGTGNTKGGHESATTELSEMISHVRKLGDDGVKENKE